MLLVLQRIGTIDGGATAGLPAVLRCRGGMALWRRAFLFNWLETVHVRLFE